MSAPVRPSGGAVAPRVLLAVHNGFAARYLLRTEILPTLLAGGAEVIVATPNAEEGYLRSELAHDRLRVAGLDVAAAERAVGGPRAQELELLHVYGTPILTDLGRRRLAAKLAQLRGRTGLYAAAVGAAAAALRRWAAARRLLLALEARLLFTADDHGALLEDHRPHLVVTTSPGYHSWPSDATLLAAARRRGVATMAAVYAWDNPSTKGLPMARPKHALAWSEGMRRELVASVGPPRPEVTITGPAIFDVYARPPSLSRPELMRRLGLPAAARLIFLATMSPFQFPFNPDYAALVARAIAAGAFGLGCALVVRRHPIYHRDPERRALHREGEAWRRLGDQPFVRFADPEILSDALSVDMPATEMQRVADLVHHSDAVVSFFSTLQLEAALADRPFVTIDFDLGDAPEATRRPTDFALHGHNRRAIASGAGVVAASPEELVAGIAACLERPEERREERRRLAEQECGFTDGCCGRRAGERMLEVARKAAGTG